METVPDNINTRENEGVVGFFTKHTRHYYPPKKPAHVLAGFLHHAQ